MRFIKFQNTKYVQLPSRNEFSDVIEHYTNLSIDEFNELYDPMLYDLNEITITLINLSTINDIFLPSELNNINLTNVQILVSENDFVKIMRKNIPNFIISLKNHNDNNKDTNKINFKNIYNWRFLEWFKHSGVVIFN